MSSIFGKALAPVLFAALFCSTIAAAKVITTTSVYPTAVVHTTTIPGNNIVAKTRPGPQAINATSIEMNIFSRIASSNSSNGYPSYAVDRLLSFFFNTAGLMTYHPAPSPASQPYTTTVRPTVVTGTVVPNGNTEATAIPMNSLAVNSIH